MEILPTQFRSTTRKPHQLASAAWAIWCAWYALTLPGLVPWQSVAIVFVAMEGAAVALGRYRGVTATLSAVIWWWVPHFVLRWALAALFALSAWAFIGAQAGLPLLIWLPAHLAWTERAAVRDEQRVETLRRHMAPSSEDLDVLERRWAQREPDPYLVWEAADRVRRSAGWADDLRR